MPHIAHIINLISLFTKLGWLNYTKKLKNKNKKLAQKLFEIVFIFTMQSKSNFFTWPLDGGK